jgi:hypothetical protein
MKPSSLSKDFWYGALAGVAANFVGLQWAAAWLFVGVLGAGMSSQPTNELQQTMLTFVWVAACCPVVFNLILFVVGAVRRKPLFWGGCLAGLLVNLLMAACLAALFAGYIALINSNPNGF